MSSAAAPDTSGPGPGAPAPCPPQASKVLPELWPRLPETGCLTVLELGRALPETIHYFNGRRCRIHVCDLYAEIAAGSLRDESGERTLERRFQDVFALPGGTRIDLCLLWDLPHFLDERMLRAFSRALWPWLGPASLAHGFGVRSAGTTLLNREYGILDRATVSVRRRNSEPLPCKPHPPAFMNEWLTCFSTERGVLLSDGKVETLMVARV